MVNFLIAVIVPLVLSFIGIYFRPNQSYEDWIEYNRYVDPKYYEKIEKRTGFSFIIISIGLVLLIQKLFALLVWSGKEVHNDYVIIYPDSWFWFIPAGFLGVLVSVVVTKKLFKTLLGERKYRFLNMYSAEKHGNLEPLGNVFGVLLGIAGLSSAILGADWKVEIHKDTLVFNEYFSFFDKEVDIFKIQHINRVDFGAKDGANRYNVTLMLEDEDIALPDFSLLHDEIMQVADDYGIAVFTRKPVMDD